MIDSHRPPQTHLQIGDPNTRPVFDTYFSHLLIFDCIYFFVILVVVVVDAGTKPLLYPLRTRLYSLEAFLTF